MGNTSSANRSGLQRGNPKVARLRQPRWIQLLLLGAGESGKSTVMKQIRLSYGSDFSQVQKLEVKPKILFSLFANMCSVLSAMETHGVQLDPAFQKDAAVVCETYAALKASTELNKFQLSKEHAQRLNTLFDSPQVQEMIRRSHTYQLEDTWTEFMSRLKNYPQWGGKAWCPGTEELLLARVRTTGVISEKFELGDSLFQIIDVGGQRSERKKWYNLFNDVSGIIYVTSISAYNQTLFEDPNVNRLTESLNLWRTTAQRPEFENSALILFMNKFDLFKIKYYDDKVPLINPLATTPKPPSIEEEENDKCEKAKEWFAEIFKSQIPRRRDEVYCHFTTALDTKLMTKVIESTSIFVMHKTLKAVGIMPIG